ncbi:MAG: hypothetical protein JXR58_02325 [Bacteroidales bacterium]|nr:hypothetical protein [Bacteroidales bacterium]
MNFAYSVYEDSSLLVINKPDNMLIHHSFYSRNVKSKSLVEILKSQRKDYLAPVHRLDMGTSGIVIFSKSPEITRLMQKQMEERLVTKKYIALVRGFTDENGIVETPIREPDSDIYKEAKTIFRRISKIELNIAVKPFPSSRYSLIELQPITGRTHQLRKHMNKISHPIIGDKKYGNRHHNSMFENELNISGMFLHAARIEFNHPEREEIITISAPFYEKWRKMAEKLGIELDY